MRLVLIAALLVCAIGCRRAPEPSNAPVAAAVSSTAVALVDTPASLRLDHTQGAGICPTRWTCSSTLLYFQQKAACEAVCGADPCYREPYCTAGCICP